MQAYFRSVVAEAGDKRRGLMVKGREGTIWSDRNVLY